MAKKIDVAGELNAATTEGIIADAAQIRYNGTNFDGGTVEEALENVSRVFDGGRADTKYGGLTTIDCGHANLN